MNVRCCTGLLPCSEASVIQDGHERFVFVTFSQAGLDKMAQGHMLADVVAIIGELMMADLRAHTLSHVF